MSKKEYTAPVIVLTIICFVVAALLGYLNSITEPIITAANLKAAEEAKQEVLPDADSFTSIDLETLSDVPDSLDSADVADNGAGAVYILTGAGYGGDMQIIVGITSDGTIAGAKVLSHSETAGLGSRVAGDDFLSQFLDKDSSLDGVSTISGSTISSKCFIGLIDDAYAVNEIIGEGGNS